MVRNQTLAWNSCLQLLSQLRSTSPMSILQSIASVSLSHLHVSVMQPNIDRKAAPEDWRYREAATFVFGCILEGPSPDQLAQLVLPGLTFLLQVGCHCVLLCSAIYFCILPCMLFVS